MEDMDYLEEVPEPQQGFSREMVWDIAALLLVLGACLLGVVFLVIFINPYVGFNPLPPPTPVPVFQTPTPTITPRALPPTWTPTPPATFTPTVTPRPLDFVTNTPITGAVITSIYTATPTSVATDTPVPVGMPFQATVQSLDGAIVHPEKNCLWMGVGGEAYDLNGEPIIGLTVHLAGTLEGKELDMYTVTGVAPQYGRGGYEFTLADRPIESTKTLYIELLDQAGLPLSEKIYFSTFPDCNKTLTLIRFKRVR